MARSFHSPLTGMLREAQAACAEAAARGAPMDEITGERAERASNLPRRQLLIGAAAVGTLAAAPRRARAVGAPRIVIVGAGLAGLSCAQNLWTGRGLASEVYEWADGVGGRVHSLRGVFAAGEVAELHGQFISSEHRRMRTLAGLYGLTLANANATLGKTEDTAWFDGQRYTQGALNMAWRDGAWDLFRDAVAKAPFANYRHASPTARAWDHISVVDWIERYVPGGIAGPLGALCAADVISEYGGPPEEQSALNLIYLLGFNTSAGSGYQFRQTPLLAGTDEKFTVLGGNDQIVAGLVKELPSGAIHAGHRLLAVRQTGTTFVCAFQRGAGVVDVPADHVVLTLPPTTLRDVDLTGVPLSPLKRTQIAELRLGSNAKIFVQVAGRPWQVDGYSGSQLTDRPIGAGWDASCFQAGSRGEDAVSIYSAFPGGAAGANLAARYGLGDRDEGPAPAAMVADALAELEPIFPGLTAAWRAGPRLAYYKDGNTDPRLMGAYSYYRIGQFTRFSGVEAQRAGNLHFAGEHTSLQFQGYMEGALQSGERAAAEI
ncbi:MAG: NAD(P)/FAD-dependent oxidoreductase [Caulobacteraceae bacterium]